MTEWGDLFTERQKVSLLAYSKCIVNRCLMALYVTFS